MKQIVFSTIYFLFLSCQIAEVLANENMKGSITPRIVEGGNAILSSHSYTLSLRHRGVFFCTAFPVSDRNVFTAGHCFANNPQLSPPYHDVTVHSGTLSVFELGIIHGIEDVIIHPEFGVQWTSNMVHDIAHILLKEETRLPFGPHQRTLQLPKTDITSGTYGILTGWGCTNMNNPNVPAQQLQALRIGILDWIYCQRRTERRLYKQQLCGIRDEGTGCTEGDSGGPLVIEGVVVGIRSWCEADCADGAPEFFTNVYQERHFIYSAMGIEPESPSPNNSPLRYKKKYGQGGVSSKKKKKSWIRRFICAAK